ncbi:MAG: helix-turn-helix domain-containing protein [Methanoregula sp.]|nr:helix-turn-helix domain-containing protein [Methanoregula sp.]
MQKPFEGVFGNTSEMRLLEFLLPLQDIEFNVTELSEEVGVSRVTATRIIKKFVKNKILKPRRVGSVTFYSLNVNSPWVEVAKRLNIVAIESILGDETLYEIHDYLEIHRPRPTSSIGPEPVSEMGWKIQRSHPMTPLDGIILDGTASSQCLSNLWNSGDPVKLNDCVV